ncbi:MAG: outer membrane protein assembly factor BamD, partial [Gammaproteobacteria bacterium]
MPSILRQKIPTLLAITLLALLGGAVAGCSSKAKDERDTKSGTSELYQRGHKAMESGNFSNAIKFYESLEARFPFSNETKQAQLDLIYCYYKDRQIEAAVDAATTFERENPTHPRVDYALYMRGLAYFSGQHSWYHRLFNVDLSERPPKNVQESFSVFSQLVQRFPASAYAADARQRMVFLRNRLADYELHVARYYMKRGAWLAAANRARYAVEQYEGAPAVPGALAIMVQAYDQLGMAEPAEDARRVLAASYPNSLKQLAREEKS